MLFWKVYIDGHLHLFMSLFTGESQIWGGHWNAERRRRDGGILGRFTQQISLCDCTHWPHEETGQSKIKWWPISQIGCELMKKNLHDDSAHCHFYSNNTVRSQLCTCHNKPGVVVHAKFWPDLIIIFHPETFVLWVCWPLLKWFPEISTKLDQ